MKFINNKILTSTLASVVFLSVYPFSNPSQAWAASSDEIISNHIDNLIDFEGEHEKAKGWGEKKYKEWKERLTSEEKESIEYYTDFDYLEINQYLREVKGKLKTSDLNNTIKHIDSALKKGRISEPITVYRRAKGFSLGINNGLLVDWKNPNKIIKENISKISEMLIGKTKTEYGYISTSLSQDAASNFSKLPILLKIHLPVGTEAAYLGNLSTNPGENEVLIGRGFTYQIEKASIIELEGREYLEIEAKGKKDRKPWKYYMIS